MALPRNNFEVVGLEELIKDLEKFGAEALKEIQPEVDNAGDILLEATKRKVPVNTGKLRDSLYLKRPRITKTSVKYANILTWGDDVRAYAAPLELGHGLVYMGRKTSQYVQPRKFLRPAADESREKIFSTIIGGMDKALKKLGDKS